MRRRHAQLAEQARPLRRARSLAFGNQALRGLCAGRTAACRQMRKPITAPWRIFRSISDAMGPAASALQAQIQLHTACAAHLSLSASSSQPLNPGMTFQCTGGAQRAGCGGGCRAAGDAAVPHKAACEACTRLAAAVVPNILCYGISDTLFHMSRHAPATAGRCHPEPTTSSCFTAGLQLATRCMQRLGRSCTRRVY